MRTGPPSEVENRPFSVYPLFQCIYDNPSMASETVMNMVSCPMELGYRVRGRTEREVRIYVWELVSVLAYT